MNRRDWFWWRFHLIRRGYTSHPQYGCMWWRSRYDGWTFDLWFRQTLWTLRTHRHW